MGQAAAEQYLCAQGFTILARNFRARYGEIDLIIRDGNYIVFVEVKYRANLSYGYPREAVGYIKQQRIYKTACYYISKHGLSDCDFRFDVVEIMDKKGMLQVTHIQDAFS